MLGAEQNRLARGPRRQNEQTWCVSFGAAALVFLHCTLVAWEALQHAPTPDEPAHLAAGIDTWQQRRFDLYRVNPPLVRTLAAFPAVLARPNADPLRSPDAAARVEFGSGVKLIKANGAASASLFSIARCACVAFSVLAAYVCFQWGRDLYGNRAGLLALALWCFCPNVLGHAQLITPDVGAAALGAAACYLFWRWLKRPDWPNAFFAGLGLGLAELTKFTWIILFLIWPVLWQIWQSSSTEDGSWRRWTRGAGKVLFILVLGVFVVNVGYAFEDSFKRLGDYNFNSRTLAGANAEANNTNAVGNRFRGTWLGTLPVPLPANYLLGIDVQKLDFERGKWSYLRGEWRFGGWWHYYLYALVVKVPIGTWMLGVLAIAVSVLLRGYSASWRDEFALLAPALTVLVVVSAETGFNHHMRYVLPAFPFGFIWMSKVARAFEFVCAPSGFPPSERGSVRGIASGALAHPHPGPLPEGEGGRRLAWLHPLIAVVVGLALVWSVASSLRVYPHSLSYFNELAGGPTNGHAHLLDSNIDWGQDLFYLKRWLDAHPEATPIGLAYFGLYPPEVAGIHATEAPRMLDPKRPSPTAKPHPIGPQPGWYAVSVNLMHGHVMGGRTVLPDYTYFLRLKPVAMAGYSIYIYHITLEDANRVRRELGLPELREGDESREMRVESREIEDKR